MRLLVLFLGLIGLTAPAPLAAQEAETLQGRVADAETGEPLAGAHVFLAGTTRGTTTGADGWYRLDHLPPGRHEIAASMLGYGTAVRRITHPMAGVPSLDFRLVPVVFDLGEVTVTAERPEDWAEHLDRFLGLFLGATPNAEQCTLLNPEVLTLTYDVEADRFRAVAQTPLVIENRALGYRVHYHLQELESVRGIVRYLGTSRFEELEPRNRREQRRWERRRRATYEGSLQHFLALLFESESVQEMRKAGFEVEVAPHFDTDPTMTIPVRSGLLLPQTALPGSRLLSFDHHLLVVYLPDVPPAPPSGLPGAAAPPASLDEYASWITLNEGPTEIDHYGQLFDPYAVTTYGRWGRERLADTLPRDYRPDR